MVKLRVNGQEQAYDGDTSMPFALVFAGRARSQLAI
jgi:hypothetical protein